MSRRLGWLAALAIAGLLAFQGLHALGRFEEIAARDAEELLAALRARVEARATRLAAEIEAGAAHARLAASLDSTRALLGGAEPGAASRAGRDATAMLRQVPSLGGMTLLDADGAERLRVERMGGGIAVIPSALLRRGEGSASRRVPSEDRVPAFERDGDRVDLREEDRLVLRFTCAVPGSRPGVAIASLYAAPILESLRRESPAPGVAWWLVDAAGSALGVAGAPQRAPLGSANDEQGVWVEAPTGPRTAEGALAWKLVAFAPRAALERGTAPLRGESLRAALGLLLTLVAVAVLGAVLVRSASAQARAEAEHAAARRVLEAERAAERRLAEGERLAALGRLTAGVAHEINNPLAGIANYLSLLRRETDPGRRMEYLDLVRHGFERIGRIVRDLRSQTAPPEPVREPVDLPTILENVIRTTAHDEGFGTIRWVRSYEPGCPPVAGDPFALEQVFLNLVLNARDALAREGAGPPEVGLAARRDPKDPGRVEVVVEDRGPGVAPEVLPRIFEPFFTTREAGTGLGLAVCASIVRAHGGTIRAENRAGGGARFVLGLPAAASARVGSAATNP